VPATFELESSSALTRPVDADLARLDSKYMRKLIPFLLAAGAFTSCQKSTPEPSEDTAALHDQFHGKYRLVSATAETAVDLNRDGQASKDLLKEIPDLTLSAGQLVLLIQNNAKLFNQFWPQPNVTRDYQQNSPDSLTVQGYADQMTPRYFSFDKSVTHLVVEPGPATSADGDRFPVPEEVTLEGNEQIRVVVNRRVFTRQGWRFVRITAWYKRYTIIT
jgi:hypothetical protein